jgi:hypothetical protein
MNAIEKQTEKNNGARGDKKGGRIPENRSNGPESRAVN